MDLFCGFTGENAQKDITFLYSTFLFLVLLILLVLTFEKKMKQSYFLDLCFVKCNALKESVLSKNFGFDT